jgi:hypothetical protein
MPRPRPQMHVTALQIILLSRSALQQLVARGECSQPLVAALDEQAHVLAACCSPYGIVAGCGLSSTVGSDRSSATAVAMSQQQSKVQAKQAPLQPQSQLQLRQQERTKGEGALQSQSQTSAASDEEQRQAPQALACSSAAIEEAQKHQEPSQEQQRRQQQQQQQQQQQPSLPRAAVPASQQDSATPFLAITQHSAQAPGGAVGAKPSEFLRR